jgi:sulfur-oxidizing protein SoxY
MVDATVARRFATGVTRRALLAIAALFAGAGAVSPSWADGEEGEFIKQLTGRTAVKSDRLHLTMPRVFPNGYTVPLALEIDSPMTEIDHVRSVRVLAPHNPLVEVVTFHFVPGRCQPRVSTRIRLAEPQFVVALADMSDGTLLMTKAWVEVATNGCS